MRTQSKDSHDHITFHSFKMSLKTVALQKLTPIIMDNPIDKIYAELRHHYQLLYLFDLQEYKQNDLTSLSLRLEGGLGLDIRERQIHQELIRKSEKNVAKRLEEKAKKRQEKSMKKKGSYLPKKEDQENEYVEQNCIIGSYPYQEQENHYYQTQKFKGNFLNGTMIILLPVRVDERGEGIQQATFQIVSSERFSQITRTTLKQCGIKIIAETVTLTVAQKRAQFRVVDGDSNIIGMNYLRNNNIITKGDYRSQQSTFTMIFTE